MYLASLVPNANRQEQKHFHLYYISVYAFGCKRNIVLRNSSSLLFAFSHNVLSIAYIYMFIRPKSFCRRPSLKHLNKDFAAKFYTYLLQRTSKFSIYSPKNMVTYSHIEI